MFNFAKIDLQANFLRRLFASLYIALLKQRATYFCNNTTIEKYKQEELSTKTISFELHKREDYCRYIENIKQESLNNFI